MKITRADKEKANRELPYPKLMVNRTGDLVVLAFEEMIADKGEDPKFTGIVLAVKDTSPLPYRVGERSSGFWVRASLIMRVRLP